MDACSALPDNEVPAVDRFVGELHGYERLLCSAFAAGARLQIAAVEAQASEGLSPVAGHQILAAISASQAAVVQALGQAAGGHRLTECLGKRLGFDVEAYGDTIKPPSAHMPMNNVEQTVA